MLDRRSVINGSLFAGLAAFTPAPQARTTSSSTADEAVVAKAVEDLNGTIEKLLDVSPELARIREQQRIFLRANQKFPDFIEIGIGVWESVYDWHVRHQQPLAMSQNAEGRYTMTVALTTLVLRPEVDANYVGNGLDAR